MPSRPAAAPSAAPSPPRRRRSPASSAMADDARTCTICGAHARDAAAMMVCCTCASAFHAKCANLPLPPEEGNVFCRHACYAAFLKQQQDGTAPRPRSDNFPDLAAQIQRVLERPDHAQQAAVLPPAQQQQHSRVGKEMQSDRTALPSNGARYGSSQAFPYEQSAVLAGSRAFIHSEPPGMLSADEHRQNQIPGDDSPFHRSRSNSSSGSSRNLMGRREVQPPTPSAGMRPDQYGGGVALPGAPTTLPMPIPGRRAFPTSGPLTPPVPEFVQNNQQVAGGGDIGPLPALFDRRRARPQSSQQSSDQDQVEPFRPRGHLIDSTSVRRVEGESVYAAPPQYTNFDRYNSHDEPMDDGRYPGRGSTQPLPSQIIAPPPPPLPTSVSEAAQSPRRNIPWTNPAAFPTDILNRFKCQADDINRVFRIDLTPVFTDKTTRLYQPEIDFFFRCFESPDVSLAVKGMGSELNQYLWAWPFFMQSCGSDTLFTFDHFQFQRSSDGTPELAYVGELKLSMASFNSYLERYLSSVPGKDVVVLEDHGTKKPVTIVASENIIALNDLVLAKHSPQLYSDLIKGFQWDVFAGGIHCLLQYLPQSCRHSRFMSPLLHFNFPGSRGRLADPGNGTTDMAYQVLAGCLELVIFDRFEVQNRDEFHRILQRTGYNADKKTMLLDSHLRALRGAGFSFSTVVLQEGEFLHVNKGRYHFWRVVEQDALGGATTAPCVFLSWEWVFQGVSQRGISTECWFAMKNASLCTSGWAFDPRRAIVEAAKCGLAIVRTGEFLRSTTGLARPNASQLLVFAPATSAGVDPDVIGQRQEQMVLFLESILPCLNALVEEEYDLSLGRDDSDEFRKFFDDETMWKLVDTELSSPPSGVADYTCGICGLELTNIYKQCLGCTVYARRARPNMVYPVFRICLRCHAQPEQHHFKPRALFSFFDKVLSSEGHTGLLPATRRYQSVRSYFKCRCQPSIRCAHCGGCESCSCLCHTLFQTRFRFTTPANLERLRSDVDGVVRWHKEQ